MKLFSILFLAVMCSLVTSKILGIEPGLISFLVSFGYYLSLLILTGGIK